MAAAAACNTRVGLWRVIHDEKRRGALNATAVWLADCVWVRSRSLLSSFSFFSLRRFQVITTRGTNGRQTYNASLRFHLWRTGQGRAGQGRAGVKDTVPNHFLRQICLNSITNSTYS